MTKLEKMLKYVSEHNEFYKNRIKEYGIKDPLDITQWPVLTRKELQENRYNMFSTGGKSKYLHQQLKRQTSSGSTGVPTSVYWDYPDYYASTLSLWRKRMKYYGISPADRCVNFTLNTFNVKKKSNIVLHKQFTTNELAINISLIQEQDLYNDVLELINEFQPKWLYIQPFVLQKLLLAYKNSGKAPPESLAYIESVGEILIPDLKQKAIDFFNVPVANLYGSEEMNGIAYECPNNHMHIVSENVYIECIKTVSGANEAVITSLTNRTMPLVRYNQGDTIIMKTLSAPCSCGSAEPVISVVKGRTSDSISICNGIELNSILLMEIIAEVNNQFADIITNYRFIYSKTGRCLLCYIEIDRFRKEWFSNIKASILNIYKSKIVPQIDIKLDVILSNEPYHFYNKHKVLKIIE